MIINGRPPQVKDDIYAPVEERWIDGLTILAKHAFTLNAGILLAFPAIFGFIHKSISNPGVYIVIGTASRGIFLSLLGLVTLLVLVHPNEKFITMHAYSVARLAALTSINMGVLSMFAAVYAILSTDKHATWPADYFVTTLLLFGSPIFILVIFSLYLRYAKASH
ncbi:MAG: hypothetical protein M0Z50_12785 [Planctomycetia bacterium]|nr:hypothetical protein [Planctomycetia bacterium]